MERFVLAVCVYIYNLYIPEKCKDYVRIINEKGKLPG